MLAVSRLLLDNIPNIKAYWISLTMPVAQVALHFGANDVQGTLVREEIFRAAGSTTGTEQKLDELVRVVRAAGRIPVQRDTLYNELRRWDARSRAAVTPCRTAGQTRTFRDSLDGIGAGGGSPNAAEAAVGGAVIRLGRIAYANMAPVFFRVDAEYEEVVGVPTELNRRLVAGELDTAPISSIEYARHADSLLLLPRLCVSSEGAVDSIQLVSKTAARRDPHGRGHARVGDVGRAHEGAAARRASTCRSARRPRRRC